jgi:hypothetical protein
MEGLVRLLALAHEAGWDRLPAPDLGVVAPADLPTVRAAAERSRECLLRAGVEGEVTVDVVLDEEGVASASPVEATTGPAIASCAADTFSGDHYTRPHTPVDGGVSTQRFSVTIRYGAPPPSFVD